MKEQETFTPGPWEYRDGGTNWNGIGPVSSTAWICRIPENDANARLIAAAPELYDQCKRFEKVLSELVVMGEADIRDRDKLRGLLAKVERNREEVPVFASVDAYAGHMLGRGEG